LAHTALKQKTFKIMKTQSQLGEAPTCFRDDTAMPFSKTEFDFHTLTLSSQFSESFPRQYRMGEWANEKEIFVRASICLLLNVAYSLPLAGVP
jgi:hypothetical protein